MDQGRNKIVGAWGEGQACLFLQRQGFVVLDRNYHTPAGEIDIVAKKGDDFYFVEVKTREVGELANDLAITKAKLYKLNKTVKAYCFRKNITAGSQIIAGIMVVYNRNNKNVSLRFAVIY